MLFGRNGSGKSSLLDCLAVLFHGLYSSLAGSQRGRSFQADDISNGKTQLSVTAELTIDGNSVDWTLTHGGSRLQQRQNVRSLHRVAAQCRKFLGKDAGDQLPLTVLYPVNRTVVDFPETSPIRPPFERGDAYDQSLSGGKLDFRRFFEWFIARENVESNVQRHKRRDHRDRHLDAVRAAISRLTGFQNLYVDQTKTPFHLMLRKGQEELAVNQLSDGERAMLALAGDLARRLATAKPEAIEPLATAGIVMIDEAELHLHPEWQARILGDLAKTFPACQFVVSTHSPELISRVPREAVYCLERTAAGVTASQPKGALGFDINTILESFMGAPVRHEKLDKDLKQLFQLIAAGELSKARALRKRIVAQTGEEIPELAQADVLTERRKLLGR